MSTEWDDVQAKFGNGEMELTTEQMEQLVDIAVAKYDPLENATLDELDEFEDDYLEDDSVLEEYRKKRMAEMAEAAQKAKYGELYDLTEPEFQKEVTEAGEGIPVVVLLYKDGIPACQLLEKYLMALAKKFPATKFMRALAYRIIPNYPDSNLPTVFVYRDGKIKNQIVGLDAIHGLKTTQDDVEWRLACLKVIDSDFIEDPREEFDRPSFSSNYIGRSLNLDEEEY
eukprot:TRINITY_DN4113_c0_g3_i3.p1 TRINITY_DN4113_c0_g3~~TRINITY_DN4113_c0_g3_i3.p1  ORF type:complete len:227 (-),score=87.40 TRINITY_DN4113_c0_g3_i3:339-1019(-)